MHHLFALLIIHAWLAIMIYSWFKNRNGEIDGRNYTKYAASHRTRWLLSGQSRETFLRQRRIMHRLTLPFVIAFYLLAMWGILFAH